MSSSYSRRTVLSVGCLSLTAGLPGCTAFESQEKKIPIFVRNETDEKYDVAVQIWATDPVRDLSVTVGALKRKKITDVRGDFCLRAFIPSYNNTKTVICPSTRDSSYSHAGYEITIRQPTDSDSQSPDLTIVPLSDDN